MNRLGNRPASGDSTQTSVVAESGDALPQARISYYRASAYDQGRLEGLACASLGLDPAQNGFKNCVKQINQALRSIDNDRLESKLQELVQRGRYARRHTHAASMRIGTQMLRRQQRSFLRLRQSPMLVRGK